MRTSRPFRRSTVTSATTGWSATEHIGLRPSSRQPASGRGSISTWSGGRTCMTRSRSPRRRERQRGREFAYSTASPLLIGAVGSGKRVIEVEVFIGRPSTPGRRRSQWGTRAHVAADGDDGQQPAGGQQLRGQAGLQSTRRRPTSISTSRPARPRPESRLCHFEGGLMKRTSFARSSFRS